MTKKDKILKIFNDAEWIEFGGYRSKVLTYEMFSDAGLSPTIEYQETYCDVIYARQILKKMGYKTLVSIALYVYDKSFTPTP